MFHLPGLSVNPLSFLGGDFQDSQGKHSLKLILKRAAQVSLTKIDMTNFPEYSGIVSDGMLSK